MKDLTEQIYGELNAQVVRMMNHSLSQASRIAELEHQLQDHSAQAFSIGETYASALSRIAELEAQLEEAETLISQTSHGAAERIADLERQLAEASAPAVEQQPVAQVAEDCVFLLRKQPNGDRWPVGTKLYTVPMAADAEKLREEILALEPEDGNDWGYVYGFGAAIRAVAGILNPASMAAQAPVREVPRWVSVNDTLPELRIDVVVYCGYMVTAQRTDDLHDPENHKGWVIDFDNGSATEITHWLPLPAAPVQQEGASNA